jgi:acyl carrier protein
MSAFEDIKSVIVDVLKIDGSEITLETRLIEDLKADSMDQFLLIDGFSEKFGISIPEDQAQKIKTVGEAVKFVEAHRK